MSSILFKTIAAWLIFVILAIVNGIFREKVLVPAMGKNFALPLSGILFSGLVFLITYILVTYIGSSKSTVYISIGIFWVILTLSFEFLFGHFVMSKSWPEMMQVFNVKKGDLFVLVLVITAVSPWAAARLRGIV